MKFKRGDIILSSEWNDGRRSHQIAQIIYINQEEYEVHVLFDNNSNKYQVEDNWVIDITDESSKKLNEEEIALFRMLYDEI